jgi:LAO/AO transport system kinase
MSRRRRQLSADEYAEGVLEGNRTTLGRTISLVESNLKKHQELAQEVLLQLLPHTGDTLRIGITGVPGVGKSTFIDQLGINLTEMGYRVAVIAVDPSSSVSRGSILGDKTRMSRLSVDENAFVRPSPTGGSLGGVARKTRETMLVCEAAGFDIILVETVGVGQSETVVADMVDMFLLLMLAGAGDELQGIKRGIMEMADLIAINKADGENEIPARRARRDYANALHYMKPRHEGWQTPVVTCSGLKNLGLDELWEKVTEFESQMRESGQLEARRREQLVKWMWDMVEDHLLTSFREHPEVKEKLDGVEADVVSGKTTPTLAAMDLLETFTGDRS